MDQISEKKQLPPEQVQRLVQDVQTANVLLDIWRRKAGKMLVDMTDRYMKARYKRFDISGGFSLGDVLKFFCAVVGTVLAHFAEQIQNDSNWTTEQATELRTLFDGLLDDYLGKVLGMPQLTTTAVIELVMRREEEAKAAREREEEAAKNREESAAMRQTQDDEAPQDAVKLPKTEPLKEVPATGD